MKKVTTKSVEAVMEQVFKEQSVSANEKPKSIRHTVRGAVQLLNITTEQGVRSVVTFVRKNREWSTSEKHPELVKFFKGVKTIVGIDPRLCASAYEQFEIKKVKTFTHPDEKADEKAE